MKEMIVQLPDDADLNTFCRQYMTEGLIRCRDCAEYAEWQDHKICMRLGSYHGDTKPNDYCSYGYQLPKKG